MLISAQMNPNGDRASHHRAKYEDIRHDMVARQIYDRGIRSPRVLAAMESVPRHLFVPPDLIGNAYADEALPSSDGQSISQPYIVAASTDALELQGHERVLEVGAGTGYQAAVVSLLAREVVGLEAIPALAESARERLARLGYPNVRVEVGDGSQGFSESAPFDAILVSAAAPSVPQPLVDQLAEGGRLVIPVGKPDHQQLLKIVKSEGRVFEKELFACRYVPLVGRYGWR
ncbi:MAG TPA: protein-L-isoaspartate(D-aspartate) O-methyltransferase [Candidatus Acidoferrum sp.]|nr:protein-L-isoaspartate(D-aspartate) O-methyltransferase [Candidatus Acidoferrum sp.]